MKQLDTLMMVDDDQVYLYLAKKAILDAGVTRNIMLMYNGRDALDYLEKNRHSETELPELIFLDLTMPVMDGWEFLEEYTQLQPRIGKPIIIYVVSSSISPDDIERARNISTVTDYLIKPVTREMYLDIVKNLT